MAPKRGTKLAGTDTNGGKAKIQKTLPFKSLKTEVKEEDVEDVVKNSESEEDVPKGKKGRGSKRSSTDTNDGKAKIQKTSPEKSESQEDVPLPKGKKGRGTKRASTDTNGGKAKIQKTLPFKSLKTEVKEEEVEDVVETSESEEDVPKGKDGKVDYKSMANILSKDFVETSKHNVFIGAHLSISGGIENAIIEAGAIGAQAVAFFLCNQRTWNVKELDENSVKKFKKACEDYGIPSHLIVPHASYLMNPGSGDKELLAKSRNLMIDGLSRCDRLGIDLYNFHPGSTTGKISIDECIKNIAETINIAHSKTLTTIAVIENMCKQGHTIGGDFKEIKKIIDMVENKSRVGVCLDTCHAFAAGYNLKTEEGFNKMMKEFEDVIGIKYLKAVHLNDSNGECGSHLDRHANIGKGKIGLKAFKRLVNDSRFKNIPMILETPVTDDNPLVYKKEVKLLYKQIE